MKFRKTVKKITLAVIIAVIALSFVPGIGTVSTQAKTKTVKGSSEYLNAPKIKKGKTYKVTVNAVNRLTDDDSALGIVQFTAPANGTYKIAVSKVANVPKSDKTVQLGLMACIRKRGNSVGTIDFKTQYGKDTYLAASNSLRYDYQYKGTTYHFRTKASGTVKLKKGETLYLPFFYSGKKCTYNLIITK